MMGERFSRGSLLICAVVLGLFALSSSAAAQTGGVKGKVVDAKNQPIEGAVIVIEMTEGMSRKYETKTDRRGEFVQVGLQPGNYKITASKEGMSQSFDQRVRLDMSQVNFALKPGMVGDASAADRKKAEEKATALKGAFSEGVTLSNDGKHEEAIAKFNQELTDEPKCVECHRWRRSECLSCLQSGRHRLERRQDSRGQGPVRGGGQGGPEHGGRTLLAGDVAGQLGHQRGDGGGEAAL